MRIKHFSKGKFYLISCPPGTRAIRCCEQPALGNPGEHDLLMVSFEGREIRIPAEPSELLPLLAEAGLCGLSLIGDPEPAIMLEGAACPNCGEDDVDWLSVEDDDGMVHCDRCGTDWGLGGRSDSGTRSRFSADEAHQDTPKPQAHPPAYQANSPSGHPRPAPGSPKTSVPTLFEEFIEGRPSASSWSATTGWVVSGVGEGWLESSVCGAASCRSSWS